MENNKQATSTIYLVYRIEGMDIRTDLDTNMGKRNIIVTVGNNG
jgi:hypothetical protein